MKRKIKNILHILFREKIPPENVVAGLFEDEKSFLQAAKKAQELYQVDAISPYPVHGLEEILKIKRSWIPWVTLIFGLLGLTGALLFTWWTSAVNWPLIIGGKPFFSLPAFIPIIFECTILFSALASVVALFCACDLPKVNPPVLDPALSSHKFALYCSTSKNEIEKVKKHFEQWGAKSVVVNLF